jgi:hypothetical protein
MQARDVAELSAPRVDLDTLDAMAALARETGLVEHVISPREHGLIERARQIAEQGGLEVGTDVRRYTTRIRFAR